MSPRQADAAVAGRLPPSTESLRRTALARSQKRGSQVARRRLAWRWTLWTMGRALRLMALPLLALGLLGAWAWWWLTDDARPPEPPAEPTAIQHSAPAAVASAAQAPDLPTPAPALPLRIDSGELEPTGAASQAQSDTHLPPGVERSAQ